MAETSGHEGARVREEDEQRVLPQVRRLAAHVRTREDDEMLPVAPERRVVRDEWLARAQRLDDGVAAALDEEHGLVHDARPHPAAGPRRAREGDEGVEEAEARAGPEDARRLGDDLRDEREKQLLLAGREARVGGAQLLVHLDELGRRVALHVRERLPLERVLGNARPRRGGHLEDVAEDLVELDAEGRRCRARHALPPSMRARMDADSRRRARTSSTAASTPSRKIPPSRA